MVHGRTVYITLDGKDVLASTSCKLSTECDTINTASPTSGPWEESIAGRKRWSVSCSWLVLSVLDMKARALSVGSTYTLVFTDGKTPVSGKAICTKCYVDTTVGALAKGSFSFKGITALT